MLYLVWEYQKRYQKTVDLVLLTGDVGIFPDVRNLDSATRKHSLTKPEELGFLALPHFLSQETQKAILNDPRSAFLQTQQKQHQRMQHSIQQLLSKLDCAFVCIGGNHEDYGYLEQCKQRSPEPTLIPLESHGRFMWLSPGAVYVWDGISIAGIDGIEAETCGRSSERYPLDALIHEDKVLTHLECLEAHNIDIFLTHDGPPSAVRTGSGSPLLLWMLQEVKPTLHFYGHYHKQSDPIDYAELYEDFQPGETTGIHINKLSFSKQGLLRPHAIGEITTNQGHLQFQFVDQAWLNTIHPNGWKTV